jgi:L-alanine-DL-glutamate epimerase-like enolase superfamily enzyme
MKLQFYPFDLQLIHPFKVSVYSRTSTPIVFLRLEQDGVIGYGESSMPPYLGETQQSVMQFLSKIELRSFTNPFEIEKILNYVDSIEDGNNAAKAGFDIALHDLVGKLKGLSVAELYGIAPVPRKTSYTIGIDTPERMAQKAEEGIEMGFEILKIKLGTNKDEEIVDQILQRWKGPFSIDANQGWHSKEVALELIQQLTERGVQFIEQPFPQRNISDTVWLSERSPVPIIADESIKRLSQLEEVKHAFGGINVKLMKTTGISEAYRLIKGAKKYNLKIVTGCMAESSCAVAAMSHLSSLADWVDLDGPFLMKNNPFEDLKLVNGVLQLPYKEGIGVDLKKRTYSKTDVI